MSFCEAFRWVYNRLREAPELRSFLPPDMVLLADRKHGDTLTPYYLMLYPSYKGNQGGSRTFESGTALSLLPQLRTHGGTAVEPYFIFIDLTCNEPEPEVRLMGLDAARPGILNFVDRVQEAIYRKPWRFKKSIQAVEFQSVTFKEGFPPPGALMALSIVEEIAPEELSADTHAVVAASGGGVEV